MVQEKWKILSNKQKSSSSTIVDTNKQTKTMMSVAPTLQGKNPMTHLKHKNVNHTTIGWDVVRSPSWTNAYLQFIAIIKGTYQYQNGTTTLYRTTQLLWRIHRFDKHNKGFLRIIIVFARVATIGQLNSVTLAMKATRSLRQLGSYITGYERWGRRDCGSVSSGTGGRPHGRGRRGRTVNNPVSLSPTGTTPDTRARIPNTCQRTSSRLMTSIWSFLWKSSHSSLYLSISSLVCRIFFFNTSNNEPCCMVVIMIMTTVAVAAGTHTRARARPTQHTRGRLNTSRNPPQHTDRYTAGTRFGGKLKSRQASNTRTVT